MWNFERDADEGLLVGPSLFVPVGLLGGLMAPGGRDGITLFTNGYIFLVSVSYIHLELLSINILLEVKSLMHM